jgi:hypothetical protein
VTLSSFPAATSTSAEAPSATTGGRAPRRGPAWPYRVVLALVVLVVLLQRLVVPLGGTEPIPVTLPLAYAAVALLLITGQVVVDRFRMELFLLAATLCVAAAVLAALRGSVLSAPSLVLLIALYTLWTLRAHTADVSALRWVANGFVTLMLLLSLVGVGQLVTQLLGLWVYEDYLGTLLPPDLTTHAYNTTIPLVFGSTTFKGNAFVFLEPSFLSQFAALGAIVALVLRAPAWKLVILVAGVFSAVSGTGVILLAVGAILVLVRARNLVRPVHVGALAITAAVILLSPVTQLLLARVSEPSSPGSSGYLRFVQPYTEVGNALAADPLRYVIGAGPGAVERLLPAARGGQEAVVYGIVPKLLFEYGLVAGGLFMLFIVLALLDRAAWRVVPGTVLVMLFFLSGSLLQPHTVIVGWLLTSFWSGRTGPRVDQLRRREAPAPVPV